VVHPAESYRYCARGTQWSSFALFSNSSVRHCVWLFPHKLSAPVRTTYQYRKGLGNGGRSSMLVIAQQTLSLNRVCTSTSNCRRPNPVKLNRKVAVLACPGAGHSENLAMDKTGCFKTLKSTGLDTLRTLTFHQVLLFG
jgi:hypothetical protein